ncbi:MAG TPA: HAD family hydrolase [Ktedonobacterales bacterium]|nr:HAD family hydrolase [Ktedonobacterales bacterium]
MTIRGAILDVDGTLVFSNDAHTHAWVEAFKEYGYDLPFEHVRPLIGMGGDKLMPTLVPGLNAREGIGKQIAERRKQIFLARYAPQLQPAPESRALIERMQHDGLRLVVASSAQRDELQVLLKAAQVDDLLQEATTASDVSESKPAPDAVATALGEIQLQPTEAVMLGDTPYDIESARKVGVGTIALRCGGTPDERLEGAIAIYDDPADLLAHYDQGPLAQAAEARNA